MAFDAGDRVSFPRRPCGCNTGEITRVGAFNIYDVSIDHSCHLDGNYDLLMGGEHLSLLPKIRHNIKKCKEMLF